MACCLTEKSGVCFSRLKDAKPREAVQDQSNDYPANILTVPVAKGRFQWDNRGKIVHTYFCFPLGFWPVTVVSLGASRAEYGFSGSRHFYSSLVGFSFLKFFILPVSTLQHAWQEESQLNFSSSALTGVLVFPGFLIA